MLINRLNVYFWLRNQKTVYCHLVVFPKRSRSFSTGVKVINDEWDEINKRCKNSNASNLILDSIETRARVIFVEMLNKSIDPDPDQIVNAIIAPQVRAMPSVNKFYAEFIEGLVNKKRSPETIRTYKSRLALLERFLKSHRYGHLPINDFDYLICKKFEKYLIDEDYKGVYINRQIETLSNIFDEAIRYKHIKENPLIKWEFLPEDKPTKVFLNHDEFISMYNCIFVSKSLQIDRDCYILQCLTGLDYFDLGYIERDMFVKYLYLGTEHPFLEGYRKKNDKSFYSIYLVPQALEILERYNWNIPVKSEQKYRESLKKIAAMLKIDKNITPKTGRKTFANLLDRQGVNIEAIVLQMGHSDSIVTRKHYVEASREKIIKMMEPVIKAV